MKWFSWTTDPLLLRFCVNGGTLVIKFIPALNFIDFTVVQLEMEVGNQTLV
jgi:hypothetical protein